MTLDAETMEKPTHEQEAEAAAWLAASTPSDAASLDDLNKLTKAQDWEGRKALICRDILADDRGEIVGGHLTPAEVGRHRARRSILLAAGIRRMIQHVACSQRRYHSD